MPLNTQFYRDLVILTRSRGSLRRWSQAQGVKIRHLGLFLFMAEAFICKDQHYEIMTIGEKSIIQTFNVEAKYSISAGASSGSATATKETVINFAMPMEYVIVDTIQTSNITVTWNNYATTKIISTSSKNIGYSSASSYIGDAPSLAGALAYLSCVMTVYLQIDFTNYRARVYANPSTPNVTSNVSGFYPPSPSDHTVSYARDVTLRFLVKYL